MLASILLFGVLHYAASDNASQSSYVTRSIASCPAEGHFFKREALHNNVEPLCYLCFCSVETNAICWRQDNKRCDSKHYSYNNVGRRDKRIRRSPSSLVEDFATREFFNKQSTEQCKPYESSFSYGCPPADWCKGCTICNCNASGRWECHVLSFCPDKDSEKQEREHRGSTRYRISKRQASIVVNSTNAVKNSPKKSTGKALYKQNVKKSQVNQNGDNHHKIDPLKGTKVKKVFPVNKKKSKSQEKKVSPNKKNVIRNNRLVKKNASTNISLNTNPSNVTNKNNTIEVPQRVVKSFINPAQKLMRKIEKRTVNSTKQSNDVMRKRSISTKNIDKKSKTFAKPVAMSKENKEKRTSQSYNPRSHQSGRNKRYISINDSVIRNFDADETTHVTFTSVYDLKTYMTENNLLMTSSATEDNRYASNSTRLEINKDIYKMDNSVTNEKESINDFAKTYFNRPSNFLSLTSPRLFTNSNFDFNKGKPYIMSNTFILNAKGTELATKMPKNNIDESGLGLKKEISNKKETKIGHLDSYNYKYNIDHGFKIWTVLRKLLDVNKNNTKQISKKVKKYTVLTKVRRLLRKIFNKKLKTKCYEVDGLNSKDCLIEYNYKFKSREMVTLQKKIEELRNESENILRTIRVLKGLLHILELSTYETRFKNNTKSSSANISKLNAIIKSAFNKEEITQELTEAQQILIDYIKSDVLKFIKSFEKIAAILDDIVQIVRRQNKTGTNIALIPRSNNNNNEKVSEGKDPKNKIQQKLHKLKDLMLNYNSLQKKFITQIYSLINSFEIKTDEIETNSTKIIRNIRKLEDLANEIKVHNRRKREIFGDQDAIQYLLILIEYLLKKHASTNTPVYYDGIDLLLDAIKNAPDIKPTKKNVLNFIPEKTHTILENLPHGPNKSAQEERNILRKLNVLEKANNSISDQSSDDHDDDGDENIDEIYQKFKSFNDSTLSQKEDAESDNIIVLRKSDDIKKIEKSSSEDKEKENTQPKTIGESNNEKLISEPDTSPSSSIPANVLLKAPAEDYSTIPNNFKGKKLYETAKSLEKKMNNFFVDVKANNDWIEENFKDTKQVRGTENSLTTPRSLKVTRTAKHPLTKSINNFSDMSNEIDTGRLNKNTSNTNEVTKQMDSLNSLDYVDDKNIEDAAISKDDKYSSDDFI